SRSPSLVSCTFGNVTRHCDNRNVPLRFGTAKASGLVVIVCRTPHCPAFQLNVLTWSPVFAIVTPQLLADASVRSQWPVSRFGNFDEMLWPPDPSPTEWRCYCHRSTDREDTYRQTSVLVLAGTRGRHRGTRRHRPGVGQGGTRRDAGLPHRQVRLAVPLVRRGGRRSADLAGVQPVRKDQVRRPRRQAGVLPAELDLDDLHRRN